MKKRVRKKTSTKRNNLSLKAGMPPGSLVHVGIQRSEPVHVEVFKYNASSAQSLDYKNLKQDFNSLSSNEVMWIHVNGVHNPSLVHDLGVFFQLHPLTQEDILVTEHPPKADFYPNYVYFTCKQPIWSAEEKGASFEQLSVVLLANTVITFSETNQHHFYEIKNAIIRNTSTIKEKTADFLFYLLIDITIDSYYCIMEQIENEIEAIEMLLINGEMAELSDIQQQKRNLIQFRKVLFPTRESLQKIRRIDSVLISSNVNLYLSDIYDHIVHLSETIESQKDILNGVLDLFHTNLSNKTNSIMKVLTIIATLFIPITFLAGVYGMNFENFPEIRWQYGYLFFWIITLLSIIGMLVFFKVKKWF